MVSGTLTLGGEGVEWPTAASAIVGRRAVTAASLACTRIGSKNSLANAGHTDAALLRLAAD